MALIGTIGTPSMISSPLRASRTDVTFTYTGASQAWTVPAGIDIIVAHLWGGGASSGYHATAVYGGAGGFTTGLLQVTPGEILRVMVGGRGENSQDSEVYGGGGGVGGDDGAFLRSGAM